MKLTVNSETTLQNAIGELRELFRTAKYYTVSVKQGKSRSLNQNDASHAWYEQIARELREDTAQGVKRYCKLHFGVPILRGEDDDFRAAYDAAILRGLTYEQKLAAMDIIPVTSLMTTTQLSRYMDEVQAHYCPRGVMLEFPEHDRRAA